MHIKSLALVAAAVLTAGAAQAADLNKPAKVAVDYVKVCDAYGAGFFYIPGSDTCLKISGSVWLQVESGSTNTNGGFYSSAPRPAPAASFADWVRANVNLDARTNTEYGLLHSVIDFTVRYQDGGGSNANTTTIELDHALVQLGCLTAGRGDTFYEFSVTNINDWNFGESSASYEVNELAYTFSFGNGVTATLSLEDPTTAGYNDNTAGVGSSYVRQFNPAGGTFQYGGLNAPDIVGNVAVTQAWGSAQLSAVAHQDYASTVAAGSKWGYGIQAGVKVNLPMLAAGDFIGIMGAYSVGDLGAIDTNYSLYHNGDIGYDATYSALTGIKQAKAYSITAGFSHFFTPKLEIDTGIAVAGVNNYSQVVANAGYGKDTYTQWEGSVDLRWKPVTGFEVLPYVEYRNVNLTSATKVNYGIGNQYTLNYGLRLTRSY